MSNFNSSTFGEISGHFGNAVAATMRDGRSILKIYRPPFNPKSAKQVAQRSKFAFVIMFLVCMRDIFVITFKTKGGYNHGCSLAFKNAVSGIAPDFVVDYSKLAFSEGGKVCESNQVSVSKTMGTTVKVDWDVSNISGNSSKGALSTDAASLIFYNEDSKEALLIEGCAKRLDATFEQELPDVWVGKEIHCWIYFSKADGLNNSKSEYIGVVQI